MKVILTQNIKNLGQKGEIINMSAGNAMNVYIPNGTVCEATKENISMYTSICKNEEEKKNKKEQNLLNIIEGLPEKFTILTRANENNILFKKLREKDIINEISHQTDQRLDDIKIFLPKIISAIGCYTVHIDGKGISKKINISIEKK